MSKIVGIGACVFDTLYNIPEYPKEDTKMRAVASKCAGGGPVATGLVAAQKLGEETAYIGVLSNDNAGLFLKSDFEKYGAKVEIITNVGPVIGAHAGPGTLALFFVGKER